MRPVGPAHDAWLSQRQALHDAANWLTVLLGHVEALSDAATGDERTRHLELARRAARAAHRLCALPPGPPSARPTGIDASAHCERLVAHVRAEARLRGVEIQLQSSVSGPVQTDGPGFDDAVLNLLRNAVEATPAGGSVCLRIAGADPGWIRVEVDDSGSGVPLEMRARLGEAGASTREGTDRGLGLSRVHGWLASHGSTLISGDSPAGGARMAFTLPLVQVRAGQVRPAADGLGILLVEDDVAVAEVLELLLAADGHQVTVRSDFGDALSHFEPGSFDLVLCDQNLPDGRGEDLLARISAADPDLRCFLVTGDPQSVQCPDASIFGVLAKPVSRAELRRTVARVAAAPDKDHSPTDPARPTGA